MTPGDYTVQTKTSDASGLAKLLAARLIITQTAPTMLTKTSTQAEVGGSGGVTGTSYANTDSSIYCFDTTSTATTCSAANPSRFSPAPTVEFQATLKAGTSGTTYAQLYDVTSAAAVSGSEVSTTNSTSYTLQKSGSITLTAGHEYRVQVKRDTANGNIANAKIVLDQSDATNGISAFETVQVYNHKVQAPTVPITYFTLNYDNSFAPANFTGNKSFYFESTMLISATGTATTQLYNKTNSDPIDTPTTSEITTTSTSYSRVRSANLANNTDWPTDASDLTVRQKCGTNCTVIGSFKNNNRSWLVIQIQSLPVPELAIFALPAVAFLPKIVSWFTRRRKLAPVESSFVGEI